MNSFYNRSELMEIGFESIGDDVLISRKSSIFSPKTIKIGNHVRIDDFCILSGVINLGSYIHISSYCALYGKNGIIMEDFTGLSPRCTIFSASDDFSGDYMIGAMLPDKVRNVYGGQVIIRQYSQVGANCIILPDVTIEEGVAIGACSLINKSLTKWGIYFGVPAKRKKTRSKKLLQYLDKINNGKEY